MEWMIGIWLFTTILGQLLRPKQRKPKPAGIDEFNFPTATADRKIPVVAGTVQIRGPNLVWYGDYRTKAIKVKSGGGPFGGGKKQTIGYKYFTGMHFVLCHGPVDAFLRIAFEKKTAWSGSVKDGQVFVDRQELFGDEDAEGGVQARVDFHSGETAQDVNSYLDGQLGGDIPAWGGLAYLVWQRPGYVGNSPSIRPMVFEVRRLPRPLNSGKHDINGDANPAELLYELHVSRDWGAGMDPAQLDTDSFLAAANTLHAEGLGISLVLERGGEVRDMIGQVLEHIDALIYSDPTTGLRVLKLVRQDYVVGDLPELHPGNVLALDKFSRGAWDETTNEVVVSYTDRADGFQQRTVTAQDLANQQVQGAVISTSLDFQGASNPTTAGLIAWRELRLRSQPMAQVTLVTNRFTNAFRPGDPFRLTWPELGITDMVFRAQRIRYGELTEGQIQIDAVQDLFATDASIFAPTPATGWQDISQAPAAAPNAAVLEAPYWIIAGDPTITDKATGNLLTVAQRPGGDVDGYEIWTRRAAQAFALRGLAGGFTPTGVLASAVTPTTTTLTLTSAVDLDLLEGADRVSGETLALVDGEWIAYDPAQVTDNGDGTFTFAGVWRGVLDTVPAAHSAGARVWLLAEASGTTADSYPPTDSVDVRMLTLTSQGTLALTSAPILSKTFTQRPSRPYPPADVKVNGVSYPAAILGAYALTWKHRDRLQQQNVIPQTDASIGPEPGTTYTLRLYGETDTLVRTETGLTGTSYTWSTEEADSGLTIPGSPGFTFNEDTFDTDSTSQYTQYAQSPASWTIAGGQLTASGGSNSKFIRNGISYTDVLIETDMTQAGDGGLVLRFVDANNFYQLAVYDDTAQSSVGAAIYRCLNGSFTNISGTTNFPWPRGTPKRFGFRASGTTLTAYVDDVQILQVADTSIAGPGGVGMRMWDSSAGASIHLAFRWDIQGSPATRLNGRIRAELESVRSGLISHQKHNLTVDRAGWGYNWGNYWGGI